MKLVISSLAFALFTGLAHAQPAPEAPLSSDTNGSQAQREATEQARHFEASLEALARKDYDRAAAEIRKGEALVEREAALAKNEARAALDGAAAELRRLAAEVESGATHNAEVLKSAFARTAQARALAQRARDGQTNRMSPFDTGA